MGASGLGHLLVEEGILHASDRVTIRKTSGNCAASFAKAVVALGLLDEDELAAFLVEASGFKRTPKNLLDQVDMDVFAKMDVNLLAKLEILPLKMHHETLIVATADPLDRTTLRQMEFFSGHKVRPLISTLTEIHRALKKLIVDFKPSESKLETFLSHHLSAAASRKRMLDEDEVMELTGSSGAAKSATEDVEIEFDDIDDESFDEDLSQNAKTTATELKALPDLPGDEPAPPAPTKAEETLEIPGPKASAPEDTAVPEGPLAAADESKETPTIEEIAPNLEGSVDLTESNSTETASSEMHSLDTPKAETDPLADLNPDEQMLQETSIQSTTEDLLAASGLDVDTPIEGAEEAAEGDENLFADLDTSPDLSDENTLELSSKKTQSAATMADVTSDLKFSIAADAKTTHEAIANINKATLSLSSKSNFDTAAVTFGQTLKSFMVKGLLLTDQVGQVTARAQWGAASTDMVSTKDLTGIDLEACKTIVSQLSDFQWTRMKADAHKAFASWSGAGQELWGCLVPAKNNGKLALMVSAAAPCMQNSILTTGIINMLKMVAKHG